MSKKTACTVTAGFASADITPKEGTHLCGGTLGIVSIVFLGM